MDLEVQMRRLQRKQVEEKNRRQEESMKMRRLLFKQLMSGKPANPELVSSEPIAPMATQADNAHDQDEVVPAASLPPVNVAAAIPASPAVVIESKRLPTRPEDVTAVLKNIIPEERPTTSISAEFEELLRSPVVRITENQTSHIPAAKETKPIQVPIPAPPAPKLEQKEEAIAVAPALINNNNSSGSSNALHNHPAAVSEPEPKKLPPPVAPSKADQSAQYQFPSLGAKKPPLVVTPQMKEARMAVPPQTKPYRDTGRFASQDPEVEEDYDNASFEKEGEDEDRKTAPQKANVVTFGKRSGEEELVAAIAPVPVAEESPSPEEKLLTTKPPEHHKTQEAEDEEDEKRQNMIVVDFGGSKVDLYS